MSVELNVGQTVVSLLGEHGEREKRDTVKALSKDRYTAKQVIRLLEKIAIYAVNIDIFIAAVATLTQIESIYTAKSLVRVLCDCSECDNLVEYFINELRGMKSSKLKARVCKELIKIVDQKDHPARACAIRCLFIADNDENVFKMLIAFLQSEGTDIVIAATDALLDMGDRRAIVPIKRHCVYNERLTHLELSGIDLFECPKGQREKLEAALRSTDRDIRFSAALPLSNQGDECAERILMYHLLHDKCWQLRELAAMALGEMPRRSNNSYYRQAALIQALKDKHPLVVHTAIFSLGKVGDEMAAKPLMDIIQSSGCVEDKAAAAYALGIGLAVPTAIDVLKHERDRMCTQVKLNSIQDHYLSVLREAVSNLSCKISLFQDIETKLEIYFSHHEIN